VSRETRGPILLVIGATLAAFAVIAYTISDFNEKTQRQEAIIREQSTLRAQDVQLIQERAKLDSRNERELQERAELRSQINTIISSLERIEKTVQTSSR
jgi:hypothetical protein